MFTKDWFFDLEKSLCAAGLDSDYETFDVIKSRLNDPKKLSPDDFARAAIYVVFASGFSQKTAKKIHETVMDFLHINDGADEQYLSGELLKIFNNINKTNAAAKIWCARKKYCDDYYALPDDLNAKLKYLSSMPHIGKITANHLARNLGIDIVKYDIWIQRLGAEFKEQIKEKINNQNLHLDVKYACDEMFSHLVRETKLPRGYIDVVLWKACQVRLIKL